MPCQDALGSSAEIMGGLAGRGDALFGGVECQKTTNSLHLHLWVFGERLHQFHSLEEIAVYLQRGLVKVDDWKDFMSNLCCESYPDPELHQQEILSLEQQWPKFTERDELNNDNQDGSVTRTKAGHLDTSPPSLLQGSSCKNKK